MQSGLVMLFATACATSRPSSVPVVSAPSSLPSLALADELAPDTHDGIRGWFVTPRGLKGLRLHFEEQLGAKDAALAGEKAAHLVDSRALDAMAKSIKPLEFMARWGMPLGIGIGTALTVAFVGIVFAILKSLPAQLIQAAQ